MEHPLGNIYVRPSACKAGYINEGDVHNYDHATLLLSGKWHIRRQNQAGQIAEEEFQAPYYLLIEATVKHTITCLEDGLYWCVYAHRTPQGDVIQDYNGWHSNYV